MPKFSIITPVHLWNQNRVNWFVRCMESVQHQTFKDFEWIVVDDGSIEPFNWTLFQKSHPYVKLLKQSHNERVIAYNLAFKNATGDWFCLLDSDDEYKPNYLERLNHYIEKYPKEKMFNFGCVFQHKDGGYAFRDPFVLKRKGAGHVKFGPGNIVNGTFAWSREIYEALGGYPPDEILEVDCSVLNYGGVRRLYMGTPYDFSAAAQLEFPELMEYFMVKHVDHPKHLVKELGNPWGQDFYLFYKYTRKYHSRVIKERLYIVHPR